MLAVIFFSMAACDSGGSTNPFSGTTWKASFEGQTIRMTFSSTDMKILSPDGPGIIETQTYTYGSNTATFMTSGLGHTTANILGNTLTVQGAGTTIVMTMV